jgi:cell division protein FtsB
MSDAAVEDMLLLRAVIERRDAQIATLTAERDALRGEMDKVQARSILLVEEFTRFLVALRRE